MLISLDGFFEGPKKEIDWHNVDQEFNTYAISFLNTVDTLVFGRVTYELMASYWPTPAALKDDPIIAEKMNSLPKLVISKTLTKAGWQNTKLVKENVAEEISKLKSQSAKNIAIFGSSDLALTLMQSNLIDEFHIIVNPVILGAGKTLFKGINKRLNLKLLRTKTFNSGNVLLCYEVAKK